MAITPMWRVTQVATGVAGSPYYYTMHFDREGGTAQQAADAWRTFLGGGAPGTYAAPLAFSPMTEVQQIDPVTGDLQALFPVTTSSVSFSDTDPLPPATTLLARWRTGVYIGGREVRGRTNISRLTEAENVSGAPGGTELTSFNSRLTAFLADPNSQPVVWSRSAGQWYPIVAASFAPQWCVLRSRRD